MGRMVRTNVVIDEALIRQVMGIYGLRSKREAIDFALRYAARTDERRKKLMELQGSGWTGDLEAIRSQQIEVIHK